MITQVMTVVLFLILQAAPFDSATDPSARLWNKLIRTPFESSLRLDAAVRLQNMVSNVMVLHRKEDIEELPKPKYIVDKLELSARERDVYNVSAGQAMLNLVLTGMVFDHHVDQGKCKTKEEDPNWRDSLLNPINYKVRADTGDASNNNKRSVTGALKIFNDLQKAACGQNRAVLSVRVVDRNEATHFQSVG